MKLDIYCKKHPKYTAKKSPSKRKCDACWILYLLSPNAFKWDDDRSVGVKQIGLVANPDVLVSR